MKRRVRKIGLRELAQARRWAERHPLTAPAQALGLEVQCPNASSPIHHGGSMKALMKAIYALIKMARRDGQHALADRLAAEYNKLLTEERNKKSKRC